MVLTGEQRKQLVPVHRAHALSRELQMHPGVCAKPAAHNHFLFQSSLGKVAWQWGPETQAGGNISKCQLKAGDSPPPPPPKRRFPWLMVVVFCF